MSTLSAPSRLSCEYEVQELRGPSTPTIRARRLNNRRLRDQKVMHGLHLADARLTNVSLRKFGDPTEVYARARGDLPIGEIRAIHEPVCTSEQGFFRDHSGWSVVCYILRVQPLTSRGLDNLSICLTDSIPSSRGRRTSSVPTCSSFSGSGK